MRICAVVRVLTVGAFACTGGSDYPLSQPMAPDAAVDARISDDDALVDAKVDASSNGSDLSIAISDSPDPVAVSSTLTYTLDVTNHGGLDAKNVVVAQRLPSGNVAFQTAIGIGWTCDANGQLVTCTRATLLVGPAPSIAVTLTTPPSGGSIATSATVTSDTTGPTDPDSANNSATQDTVVNAPSDLALVLQASPSPVPAGSTLTYTIDVTNLGPRDSANLVVTNRLPDGNVLFQSAGGIGWTCALAGQIVTCTRLTLLVGAAPSIAIKITTPSANGPLIDQASVSASTDDLVLVNNNASATTNVFDSADLSIVASENLNPVRISTDLIYTLSVGNGGPTAATEVSVVDRLPTGTTFVSASGTGWSCAELGGSVTCTMASLDAQASAPEISIVATAPGTAGNITNIANVSSATSDPSGANNTATTVALANLFADLSVAVSDAPDDPVQGTTATGCFNSDCVTYTIDVSNAGPDAASELRIVTVLPPDGTFYNGVGPGWVCPAPLAGRLTCTRTSLDIGDTKTISLTWKAPSPGGFSIVVTSTTNAGSTDPNAANNTATQDTTVKP